MSKLFSELRNRFLSSEEQASNDARARITIAALGYNYRVEEHDGELVGLCDAFPSLSFIDNHRDGAHEGIIKLVESCVEDMLQTGESIPRAEWAYRRLLMELVHARQIQGYSDIDENRYVTNLDMLWRSLTVEEQEHIESIPDTRCYACGNHLETIDFGSKSGSGCKDCLAHSRIEIGISKLGYV